MLPVTSRNIWYHFQYGSRLKTQSCILAEVVVTFFNGKPLLLVLVTLEFPVDFAQQSKGVPPVMDRFQTGR